MECKELDLEIIRKQYKCIDLTRMECKVIVYPSGYEQLESIDLTRLECKDQRDPVTAAS